MLALIKSGSSSVNQENRDEKGREIRARTPVEEKTASAVRGVSLSPMFKETLINYTF
ncbi:MAG: hypothetical protein S4CHLAM27_11290 [Chlamydiia bacterium]|nr:hypothetical protein [Chlamydiia bacterium]